MAPMLAPPRSGFRMSLRQSKSIDMCSSCMVNAHALKPIRAHQDDFYCKSLAAKATNPVSSGLPIILVPDHIWDAEGSENDAAS